MNKFIGRIIEVFIPNNNIESNKIGFKILINNKIIEIVEDQDEYNSYLYKNDRVIITKIENKYEIEKI